jgi:hypothetical protein
MGDQITNAGYVFSSAKKNVAYGFGDWRFTISDDSSFRSLHPWSDQ